MTLGGNTDHCETCSSQNSLQHGPFNSIIGAKAAKLGYKWLCLQGVKELVVKGQIVSFRPPKPFPKVVWLVWWCDSGSCGAVVVWVVHNIHIIGGGYLWGDPESSPMNFNNQPDQHNWNNSLQFQSSTQQWPGQWPSSGNRVWGKVGWSGYSEICTHESPVR